MGLSETLWMSFVCSRLEKFSSNFSSNDLTAEGKKDLGVNVIV